jgi:hypothetical protein
MAYHPLTNETGGTAEDRRNEADRILKIMDDADLDTLGMKQHERDFVDQMVGDSDVSPKQLFWLRDLKAKYVDNI